MPSDNPYRVVLVAGNFEKRHFVDTRFDPEAPKTVDMAYLAELALVIKLVHGADPVHVFSSAVKEEAEGKTLWDGVVEVFALVRHPETNRCYAWGNRRPDGKWDITTVLAVPPVDSPQAAVRSIVSPPPTKEPLKG